jgi:hypothetical protein
MGIEDVLLDPRSGREVVPALAELDEPGRTVLKTASIHVRMLNVAGTTGVLSGHGPAIRVELVKIAGG